MARVIIRSGIFHLRVEYEIPMDISFNQFKTRILKRFGNLSGTSNANKHKVTAMLKNAQSVEELCINAYGWRIDIEL